MPDDLSDRFDIAIDPEADPVDFDGVLAEFLLNYVRQQDEGADQGQ